MPVESATSNGADENSVNIKEEQKGWLSKRTHFTHRWKPTWFQLKETQLLYGEREEKPLKTINLVGAVVESMEGEGSFGWTITSKERNRIFYFKACSAAEQERWMSAICQAQLSCIQHGPKACVLQ